MARSNPAQRGFLRRLLPNRELSREVLRLATPVTLGTLTFTLLSIVDTAMLGHLGALPLAASGVAGVFFFSLVFPVASISVGTQTLVARRFGEERRELCGQVMNTGLAVGLVFGVLFAILSPWLARIIAPITSNDPLVQEAGAVYLNFRFLGAPFMLFNSVSLGFFAGIGRTKHQLVGSILITATNILLDYLLIFGKGGFPQLGIRGAAIASTIALGLGSVYYLVVLVLPSYRAEFGALQRPWIAAKWLAPMVKLSLPILAQRILSNGAWAIFFTIIARIGTIELAATNVIRSVIHLSIMIAVGLGIASAALIGQNLGAKKPDHAEKLAWESAKLATIAMVLVGALFVFVPGFVYRIYTSDPVVIAAGRVPLILLGFVQIFVGIALVFSQSLQGAGNTRFVMLVEILCVACYLPTVWWLGLNTSLGLVGAWIGEYVYWIMLATAMFLKFRTGTWKSISV